MPDAKKQLKNKQNKLHLKKHDSLKKAYALKNNGDYNPNKYHDISNIIESGDYGLDVLGNTIGDQVIPGKIINLGNQLYENNPSEYGRAINLGLELTKNITPFWGDAGINALQKGVSYLSSENPKGIDRAYENYFNNEKGAKYSNGGYMKKLKYNKKGTYPTYEFPPMAFGGWLDQLPQQYGNGGDLPPMEVSSGLPKYGKKRVLNFKDYRKKNTTSNRFPVVQNPFSRENKVNLHFPENHGEEHRRLEVNPYFGGVNVEPDVNVYYGGVNADLNLLNKNNNKLDLRGGLNTGLVTYPGGSEFTGVNPSVGLSYSRKFVEGGWLDELPNQYPDGGSLGDDPTKPYHPTLNPDGYKGNNPVTSNDSLEVYNNAIQLQNYYNKALSDKTYRYTGTNQYSDGYFNIVYDAYNKDLNSLKAAIQNPENYGYNVNEFNTNTIKKALYNKYTQSSKDRNKINTSDVVGGGIINLEAPNIIFNRRLPPDYLKDYQATNTNKYNNSDIATVPYYSPERLNELKPWALRTDAEKKKELLRRGIYKTINDTNSITIPSTSVEDKIEPRIPYSPVQINPNSIVQLPINNIPLQQMPTIGIGEPTFEGNNAYWKKQDNQLIYQNNDYSNNRNLPISNKPGDRFHQEPSWMVGDDRYYERDGEAYLVPQPKGGWSRKQILDPSSGKWKSKIVKKQKGGGVDELQDGSNTLYHSRKPIEGKQDPYQLMRFIKSYIGPNDLDIQERPYKKPIPSYKDLYKDIYYDLYPDQIRGDKKVQKGGWLDTLPMAQNGKMLTREKKRLLKEKEFEDFLKKSSVDEQGTLTYVLPEYTVKSPEKKLYDEAFQDALNKQKSFQNKWYPGDISEGVLDNMKQRANVIASDKVAKNILKNNKVKDLKDYQKEYIANSNYSGKLRPGIFKEFTEGVQDLSRITQGKLPTSKSLGILSPLEYPVNLVRGTVKGEGLDALKGKISSPWIDASKVDIGAVNDVGAYNTIYNIGLDPLNLTGIGLTGAADDVLKGISKGSKYFKTNKIVNTPKQLFGSGNVLDLEELRRVYHNSERFLMPEESRFLHKHGYGKASQYRNNNWGNNFTPEQVDEWWRIRDSNNQLPPPPSEIQFTPDGITRTVYNQNPTGWEQPSIPIMLGGIDIRRPINGHAPGTPEWNRLNDSIAQNTRGSYLSKSKTPLNKSGLTKEEVLQKASGKDKDKISKMSETEFENTVLKPNGEVVLYKPGTEVEQMTYDLGTRNLKLKDATKMSDKEYVDEFNSRLDLLNDIIAQTNKSGVAYKVKGLDENGRLVFYTPSGQKGKNPLIKGGLEDVNIPEGESTWSVGINPGQWRGNVEDIANTEYFRSIPGLEMSNTTAGVFSDHIPRKGTGAYEAINDYLKRLDLGRVKPGFNSQTEFSRGAWENFIKSGRGVGFYANPRTVYGTMKSIFPYVGAGYLGYEGLQKAGALQEKQYGGWLDKL